MSPGQKQTSKGKQSNTGTTNKKHSKRNAPNDGARQPRKRTKTGCLTCRKRRIKCGEERPTCLNCHKSRRECEGYRPPIVFRRSHHLHSGQPEVSLAPHSGLNNPYFSTLASQLSDVGHEGHGWSSVPLGWGEASGTEPAADFGPGLTHASSHQGVPGTGPQLAFSTADYEQPALPFFDGNVWQLPTANSAQKSGYLAHDQPSQTHTPGITPLSQDETLSLFHEAGRDPSQYSQDQYRADLQSGYDISHTPSAEYPPVSLEPSSGQTMPTIFPFDYTIEGQVNRDPMDFMKPVAGPQSKFPSNFAFVSTADYHPLHAPHLKSIFQPPDFGNPGMSQFLDAAAVSIQDDDYWDLPSDEDSNADSLAQFETSSLERDFDTITALTKASMALAISNLTNANAYTYPGFSLDSYRPERTASPLRNPYTQRVFAHFIFSTGPLLSYLQQRNRIIISSQSAGGPITSSYQGLWTYALATMALHNQGLLHAMLAMASLHMAKLQGASVTPSLKHYSYSLRRVHRDVQHDRKRHEVPTLAATLLLAFYEIMQADHRKWSTHLVGAKQLMSEIDFGGMTAQVDYLKIKSAIHSEKRSYFVGNSSSSRMHNGEGPLHESPLALIFPDPDLLLVNKLMGKRTMYDEQGRIITDWHPPRNLDDLSSAELRNFQILQDLFWWNCRHDIIHGLVGGNALLLDYSKWNVCQPRARVGDPNAVHGSFDYFMLLMGRLVKFITDDRPRKVRASHAAGSSAVPSGTNPRSAQSAPQPSNHAPAGGAKTSNPLPPPPAGPGFYGMAPSFGPSPLPRAFQKPDAQPSPSSDTDTDEDIDLESATAMAIQEWNDIFSAFTALADAWCPAFEPLADADHAPFDTPFGPAVIFESYAIAALWAWYYSGLIIALRSHPSMPAPATVAIGYAAQQTAKYANQVGRIVYCITSDFLTPPLDPSSAGAFSEASMPLFFAAVQFVDPDQRRWTINRLLEIERLTGWATVGLCANGCESAWVKAHAMGRGPKYVRCTGIQKGEGSVRMSEEEQEEKGPLGGSVGNAAGSNGAPHIKRAGSSNSSGSGGHRKLVEMERRFTPFYSGSQVMWAYQLYSAPLEEDMAERGP